MVNSIRGFINGFNGSRPTVIVCPPDDAEERSALAQQVHDSKQSLLEGRINYGNDKVADINKELQSVPPTIKPCRSNEPIKNPRSKELTDQRAKQESVINQARAELSKPEQASAHNDNKSVAELKKELREIKFGTLELTKDKEQLDNKKIDEELAVQNKKLEGVQACGGATGINKKITELNAGKAANNDDIKNAKLEMKNIQLEISNDDTEYSPAEIKRSRSTNKDLQKSMDAIKQRGIGILSEQELDDMRTMLTKSLPYLKTAYNKGIAGLEKSFAELNPAMRDQLNKELGMGDVLKNVEHVKKEKEMRIEEQSEGFTLSGRDQLFNGLSAGAQYQQKGRFMPS